MGYAFRVLLSMSAEAGAASPAAQMLRLAVGLLGMEVALSMPLHCEIPRALPTLHNYIHQNLVLESILKLRTSKITFDLGIIFKCFFLLCWAILLTVEIDCANTQLHHVNIVSTCVFGV